jgi:hypothetical protein
MTWYQPETRLDRWLELYRAVARGNGAEPDAGRRLLDWAHAARYREVVSTATVWCYGTPQGRAWWGGLWAERITRSAQAEREQEQAVARGLADQGRTG